MGSFLRPRGLGCDRVSADGEEKTPVLGQEKLSFEKGSSCTGYFRSSASLLHPPSTEKKKKKKYKTVLTKHLSSFRAAAFPRRTGAAADLCSEAGQRTRV